MLRIFVYLRRSIKKSFDNLQNEIAKLDSRTPFEFNLKAVGETSDANTLDQITDGIKQNISIGKSEFAIKLTPETLGEITVKLVEEAGTEKIRRVERR